MSVQLLDTVRSSPEETEQGHRAVLEALTQTLGSDADPSLLYRLADGFTAQHFNKSEAVLLAGEQWHQVILIEQGMLRLCYCDQDGREFNKGFFHEGQLIWPIAPSARQAASLFSILCLEHCSIQVADFAWFKRHLEAAGSWSGFALPFTEWLAEEKFLREYEFLLYSALERYQRFRDQYPELAERIPDYHLASYLGMSNVTLSRLKRCCV
ncbi:Crp/Fnr family transcriptional regulator [Halovibrio salipaludis]|uniref:Crp/Fnr family transcriptional regulator n=1 Tax=Halovibrio salipaludis TaxID=2032626 RepID=A0A2A2F8D2_9GAMM|nr:Crp/Fnr family transcriptional regulator [Halovibrio salipaludis]PAU81791.1 Crp/Fnr family transcriptional regulator [Halovibrio salipaludis]